MKLSRALIVLVGLAVPQIAQAAPITYSEASSIDLGPPLQTFVLDIGANTISGTTRFLADQTTDPDDFRFTVPTGTQLTSIAFSFSTTATPTTTTARITPVLFFNTIPVSEIGSQAINLLGAGSVFVLPASLPLLADTYLLELRGFASGGSGTVEWSTNYTWTLNVEAVPAPVPEPASMTLLGLGLAALGARRWRQRH